MVMTMSEITNPGSIQRDPRFPNAPGDWCLDDALAAAAADRIELSEDRLETIRALQRLFAAPEPPNIRALHDALDEHFHARGGLKYLYELFPGGPVAQGCRYAGLKAPAGAVDKSFGSVQ